MSAKQGNSRNRIRIKHITVCSLLVAICLIVGYFENLFSITLMTMVPGAKIGLSNAIVLMLVCSGDYKGAWAVNVSRICLSALLFGTTVSFLLSVAGGVTSTLVACILSRSKNVSVIGISIAAAVTHNLFQLIAAMLLVGIGVVYYLPVLIAIGVVCGALCGVLARLILKHSKMFRF